MKLISIALIMGFLGCTPAAEPSQGNQPIRFDPQELERTHGGNALITPVSLCETLAILTGGAGEYRVELITSYMEEVSGRDESTPMTYVELSRLAAWSDTAPNRPTIRMTGGVQVSGSVGGFPVSLRRGETVGMLLTAPAPDNLDFYGIHPLGLFQMVSEGGYSNSMHFTSGDKSLGQVGQKVALAYGKSGEDCEPFDVLPNVSSMEQLDSGSDQVNLGVRSLTKDAAP